VTRDAGGAPAPVRTLADALRGRDDTALAELLVSRPDLARPTPADVGQLAARAAGRASVTYAMDRLDTAHLTVLAAIARLSPPVSAADVRLAVPGAAATVDRVLARLRALALVWGGGDDLRLVRAAHEVLEADLARRPDIDGPIDQLPAPETNVQDPTVVDRAGAAAAYELVRRVELALEAWGAMPPTVLRAGGVGVRDVRAVASRLAVSETDVGLLLELAHAADLLSVGDDPQLDEVWLPTRDFDRWRALPPAQRWVRLAAAWLATPRATVLVGDRDDRDRPINPLAPDLARGAAAAVRAATLDVLAGAAQGAAVGDPGQVVAAVAWARPRRRALRDALVRRTLVEAATIGVTAMAALTGHGRALLTDPASAADLLAPLLPNPVDHVLILGDLTAVAPGPLDPEVAHGLALLADVESRGGATVYRFTTQSVRRALDAGWPASKVHEFVAAHSRTPVPQPLTYLVDDAARLHGRLRVGAGAVYLRADDPAELDTVLADSALASLHLRRMAPTVALSDLPADVVLDRLRKAGRAPLLEGADSRAVREVTGDRRARARRPPPVDRLGLDRTEAASVVAAVRAGERAAAARPDRGDAPGPIRLVAELRAAAEDERTVWLSYLDDAGTRSERVVDPLDVEDGRLTAFDHRSGRTRTFALHRISQVSGSV